MKNLSKFGALQTHLRDDTTFEIKFNPLFIAKFLGTAFFIEHLWWLLLKNPLLS